MQDGYVNIPYKIWNHEEETGKAALEGMRLLEKGTCLRFKEREDEEDFLYFLSKPFQCRSRVGRKG